MLSDLYRAELGDTEKIAARIDEYQKRFANPFVAAERGYIDEVILPRNTRRRICRGLNMLRNKKAENPWKKHDNIPAWASASNHRFASIGLPKHRDQAGRIFYFVRDEPNNCNRGRFSTNHITSRL
ncbi:MAG: carboxyl transferase domain-containing protein [Hyphomicrobiaceae bacterium]